MIACQIFAKYDFFGQSRYVESVRIKSFSGPYFPAFGLNTEIYIFHISPYSVKIRTLTQFRFVTINCFFSLSCYGKDIIQNGRMEAIERRHKNRRYEN